MHKPFFPISLFLLTEKGLLICIEICTEICIDKMCTFTVNQRIYCARIPRQGLKSQRQESTHKNNQEVPTDIYQNGKNQTFSVKMLDNCTYMKPPLQVHEWYKCFKKTFSSQGKKRKPSNLQVLSDEDTVLNTSAEQGASVQVSVYITLSWLALWNCVSEGTRIVLHLSHRTPLSNRLSQVEWLFY